MGWTTRLTALFFLIILACGCAKRTLVVLVPEPDGRTGSISVRNQAGSVAIDAPYQATSAGDVEKRPAAPVHLDKKAVDRMFAEALSIEPKRPLHFQLFFLGKTELTCESEKLLSAIVAAIRERNSAYVSVIGHADTLGAEDWNIELSYSRAKAVKDLLVKRGVAPNAIQTDYQGERGPWAPTADEVYEPKNRRVEVVVR